MTLLLMEGFDHRAVTARVGSYTGTAAAYAAGRVGGYALIPGGAGNLTYNLSFPTSTGIWLSFVIKRGGSNTFVVPIIVKAGSTQQAQILIATTGFITLNNYIGNFVGTTTTPIHATDWTRVDIFIPWADAGTAQIYINGNLVMSAVGDFKSVATSFNEITFGLGTTTSYVAIDDLYLVNTDGSSPYNDRLPDMRIETLYPNGNGSSSQLLGSDGNSTDNYLLVDESPASAADYVTSATAGQRDLYTFDNLTTAVGAVYAVQVSAHASKSDSGAASLAPLTLTAGTEREEAAIGLSTTASYISGVINTTDPSGGAWTVAAVNGSEFGLEVG